MKRREFLIRSMAASASVSLISKPLLASAIDAAAASRVTVLLVDTDRISIPIDDRIYGQFLEHINHAVVDGLFAEQIRGAGFEGEDFKTYWEPFAESGRVEIANVEFQNGVTSVRLDVEGGHAGIRQGRVFLDKGIEYDGSLWARRERGSPQLAFRVKSSKGETIASVPLSLAGSEWQELHYSFISPVRDTQASVEIEAKGRGALLVDFVSMMRADARRNGMLRPDLLQALRGLKPSFIRWPGGSFASTYKWEDGIGLHSARRYHPNVMWGGYSDYYGFGTDEFLGLCKRLGAKHSSYCLHLAPGLSRFSTQWTGCIT